MTNERQSRERLISHILENERRVKGLSLPEIAHKVGVTGPTICKWESGEMSPSSFARWARWAEALGFRFHITFERIGK